MAYIVMPYDRAYNGYGPYGYGLYRYGLYMAGYAVDSRDFEGIVDAHLAIATWGDNCTSHNHTAP